MKPFAHVDLIVSNANASIAFYEKALGCEVVEDCVVRGPIAEFYGGGLAESVRLVLLKFQGPRAAITPMIELMELGLTPEGVSAANAERARTQGVPRVAPCIRNFTVLVTDLGEMLEALAAMGVQPASPRMEVDLPRLGRATIVFVPDPDGNLIELAEPIRRPS